MGATAEQPLRTLDVRRRVSTSTRQAEVVSPDEMRDSATMPVSGKAGHMFPMTKAQPIAPATGPTISAIRAAAMRGGLGAFSQAATTVRAQPTLTRSMARIARAFVTI